jgi:hypothetical protein
MAHAQRLNDLPSWKITEIACAQAWLNFYYEEGPGSKLESECKANNITEKEWLMVNLWQPLKLQEMCTAECECSFNKELAELAPSFEIETPTSAGSGIEVPGTPLEIVEVRD